MESLTVRDSLIKKAENGILLSKNDIELIGTVSFLKTRLVYPLFFLHFANKSSVPTPSLSFSTEGNGMVAYNTKKDLLRDLTDIYGIEWKKCVLHRSHHYKIIGTDHLEPQLLYQIGEILDLFYENSIIKRNVDRDLLAGLESRISQTQKLNDYDFKNLPEIIIRYTGLESAIIRLRKNLDFALLEGCLSDIELSNLIETEDGKGALHNAITYCKPQFFEVSIDRLRSQYIIFPLIRKSIFTTKRPIQPRYLLLVFADTGFSKTQLDNIEHIIQLAQENAIKNMLKSLEKSRKHLARIARIKHPPSLVSYDYFLRIFKRYCALVASQVLRTTSAHSATIRLYEHGSRSLVVIASRNDQEGVYDITPDKAVINIKSQRCHSLNAFIFSHSLNKQGSDFGYLPNISPSNPKIPKIPEDLRKKGLEDVVCARSNTKSEICFRVLYREVPVGTFNIESPVARAFDDQIEYLVLLRDYIQFAFELTLGYNDISSLSRQIINHAAVHELDQYLNKPSPIFNEDQRVLLKETFSLRTKSKAYKTTLQEWLIQWVQQAYKSQTDQTQYQISRVVNILSISPSDMSDDFLVGLQFILKNLIQNIVDHGCIDEGPDLNCIILDDRPLYGVGLNNQLRIVCKLSPIREENILDKICIAPIITESGEARFGMLLIGMICKVLGGFFFINRDSLSQFTEILIILPYSQTNDH